MSNVLTFNSVSAKVVQALKDEFGEPDKDGVVKGETPLGEVQLRPAFSDMGGAGSLIVEVVHKPLLLSHATIQTRIQDKINALQAKLDKPEEPVKEEKPTKQEAKKAEPEAKKADAAKPDEKPAPAKAS